MCRLAMLHRNALRALFDRPINCSVDNGRLADVSPDWRWQWVFPSITISFDPRTGWRGWHRVHEGTVSHAITQAGRRANLTQRPTAPSFRPSFATHLLEADQDIRTVLADAAG